MSKIDNTRLREVCDYASFRAYEYRDKHIGQMYRDITYALYELRMKRASAGEYVRDQKVRFTAACKGGCEC